ncbi:MFS transporter [Lichenicoccus sp.]|uniref:MFS transporter n=1 Tax=Lichenicoccus sp. TaxID=2781899 RepID=UPI003D0C5973
MKAPTSATRYVLLSVALLVFGTNLQGVLLPILGAEHGAPMITIGLFSSAWSAGFVLACLSVGRLLGALGHVRSFVALAGLSAFASLLLLYSGDWSWITLRAVIGFCFGGLSTVIESWLLESAGSGAFSGYMMVNLIASLSGTLSLDVVDPLGRAPFVLMTAAVALSSLPVLFARKGAVKPAAVTRFRLAPGRLYRRSPLGATGVLAAGLITGAVGGLGPVFGMEAGLSMGGDTLMLAANSIGGAFGYAQNALLAERIGHRLLLVLTCMLGLLTCMPLALSAHALGYDLVVVLFGVFGFAQYPLYGICVGLVNREAIGISAAQTASEVLLLFGLGTVAGPLCAAPLMRLGLNLFVFVACVLLALLVRLAIEVGPKGRSHHARAPG